MLAFLYLVSSFVVDEFTTVNSNRTTRIGEKWHRAPSLQGWEREWCDGAVEAHDHDFNMISLRESEFSWQLTRWRSGLILFLYNPWSNPGPTNGPQPILTHKITVIASGLHSNDVEFHRLIGKTLNLYIQFLPLRTGFIQRQKNCLSAFIPPFWNLLDSKKSHDLDYVLEILYLKHWWCALVAGSIPTSLSLSKDREGIVLVEGWNFIQRFPTISWMLTNLEAKTLLQLKRESVTGEIKWK